MILGKLSLSAPDFGERLGSFQLVGGNPGGFERDWDWPLNDDLFFFRICSELATQLQLSDVSMV